MRTHTVFSDVEASVVSGQENENSQVYFDLIGINMPYLKGIETFPFNPNSSIRIWGVLT